MHARMASRYVVRAWLDCTCPANTNKLRMCMKHHTIQCSVLVISMYIRFLSDFPPYQRMYVHTWLLYHVHVMYTCVCVETVYTQFVHIFIVQYCHVMMQHVTCILYTLCVGACIPYTLYVVMYYYLCGVHSYIQASLDSRHVQCGGHIHVYL